MKKKRILIITLTLTVLATILAVVLLCGFSSAQSDAPVTLIEAGVTKWRYKAMTHDQFGSTNSDWYQNSRATNSWSSGTSPFGDRIDFDHGSAKSGWIDDDHVLLLATTFNISDLNTAQNKSFVAHVWYDSNMTIYLNGAYVHYAQGHVDDYVDLTLDFSGALKRGENLLAISIEDSSGGREFDMTLTMQTPGSKNPSLDPSLTVTEQQLKSTGLSTLYINTDDGDYVTSRLEYKSGTLQIGLSDSDKSYTNTFTGTGGKISIRGRGNSTWNNGYPDGKQNTLPGDTHTRKVPYNLKLSEKANLFGLGKSKKWVLIANYMDRSLLRNKLIYDLSGRMGMVFCKSVYVNLVLNGEYMGTYALTQKIEPDLFGDEVTDWEDLAEDFAKAVAKKEGKNSAWQDDFEDQLCADMSWLTSKTYKYKNVTYTVADYVDLSKVDLYSGYLMEYDGYADEDSFFTTNHGVPLKVSNMEAIKTNPTLFNYVRDFFNDFEAACYGENFVNSKGKHYTDYVDMDSLVDCFILNTVILNVEFGYKSMYMYINSEGKIVFGPCWDYDWSSGNPFLGANGQYDQWYNDGRAANNKWYRRLYGDPYFVSLVRERWSQLGDALDEMVDSMDYYYKLLSKAEELEYAKFGSDPYETDFWWRTGGRSFKDEVDQLKNFLKNRIAWLDAQFAKREPNIEGFGMNTDGSLILNLSGSSIASGGLADFRLTKSTGDFTLAITSTHSCTAEIWINGALVNTLALTQNSRRTLVLSGKDLLPGINTITVYQYQGSKLYGANYLTLSLDGTKRAAPAAGSYTGGYADKSAEPPKTQGGENPPTPSVTTDNNPAESSQNPATSQTPTVSDSNGTPSRTEPAVSDPNGTTPQTDPESGDQTGSVSSQNPPATGDSSDNPVVSPGTGEGTDGQPPKTPTPTGGTAEIDPVTPEQSDSEKGGGALLPILVAAIVVIAAGAAAAVIVIVKKRRR